jgi:hypothetical protein
MGFNEIGSAPGIPGGVPIRQHMLPIVKLHRSCGCVQHGEGQCGIVGALGQDAEKLLGFC